MSMSDGILTGMFFKDVEKHALPQLHVDGECGADLLADILGVRAMWGVGARHAS